MRKIMKKTARERLVTDYPSIHSLILWSSLASTTGYYATLLPKTIEDTALLKTKNIHKYRQNEKALSVSVSNI